MIHNASKVDLKNLQKKLQISLKKIKILGAPRFGAVFISAQTTTWHVEPFTVKQLGLGPLEKTFN